MLEIFRRACGFACVKLQIIEYRVSLRISVFKNEVCNCTFRDSVMPLRVIMGRWILYLSDKISNQFFFVLLIHVHDEKMTIPVPLWNMESWTGQN